jgi:hypothetical protein
MHFFSEPSAECSSVPSWGLLAGAPFLNGRSQRRDKPLSWQPPSDLKWAHRPIRLARLPAASVSPLTTRSPFSGTHCPFRGQRGEEGTNPIVLSLPLGQASCRTCSPRPAASPAGCLSGYFPRPPIGAVLLAVLLYLITPLPLWRGLNDLAS